MEAGKKYPSSQSRGARVSASEGPKQTRPAITKTIEISETSHPFPGEHDPQRLRALRCASLSPKDSISSTREPIFFRAELFPGGGGFMQMQGFLCGVMYKTGGTCGGGATGVISKVLWGENGFSPVSICMRKRASEIGILFSSMRCRWIETAFYLPKGNLFCRSISGCMRKSHGINQFSNHSFWSNLIFQYLNEAMAEKNFWCNTETVSKYTIQAYKIKYKLLKIIN